MQERRSPKSQKLANVANVVTCNSRAIFEIEEIKDRVHKVV